MNMIDGGIDVGANEYDDTEYVSGKNTRFVIVLDNGDRVVKDFEADYLASAAVKRCDMANVIRTGDRILTLNDGLTLIKFNIDHIVYVCTTAPDDGNHYEHYTLICAGCGGY